MARILDWKRSEDSRDIVHVVVQALAEGQLVALPAETAYHVVASGLRSEAVAKLLAYAGRCPDRAPCIFLRSPEESLDYSPRLSRVARRIVSRGWPGPLVIELESAVEGSLLYQLPDEVRRDLLVDDRFLSQRVAAHPALAQSMLLLPGPLVAAPLLDHSNLAACTGQVVATEATSELAWLVDDGSTHFGGFATALRIDDNQLSITHRGILDDSVLLGLSQLQIVSICTGNTCRSPMAETILRDLLRQRFPKLFAKGKPEPAVTTSAGLSAFPGGNASSEAAAVMHKRGLSLKDHQSRPVTERLLKGADLILTMTASHRNAIVQRWPDLAPKTHLLCIDGHDVSDPFGGSVSVYADCAEQIELFLSQWLDRIDESWFPIWLEPSS